LFNIHGGSVEESGAYVNVALNSHQLVIVAARLGMAENSQTGKA
jgi:hypothetical protein